MGVHPREGQRGWGLTRCGALVQAIISSFSATQTDICGGIVAAWPVLLGQCRNLVVANAVEIA